MSKDLTPNEKQKEILENIEGPQIIVAGPGTGKTATLILKIQKLINEMKIPPDNILVLTFTNKAANEINTRIGLPNFVFTFHSFCSYLLKIKNITYKLIPDYKRKKIIQEVASLHNLSHNDLDIAISRYKNMASYNIDKKIILEYEKTLQKDNFWDFDDLILKTFNLLKNDEVIQFQKLKKYKYIFIDEFQDTSKIQYNLIKLFLGANQNICVIGDPNQSIYSFRGADPTIFGEFKNDFINCKLFFLNENYRSNNKIIEVINQIFPDQKLIGKSYEDCEMGIVNTLNGNTQGRWIVDFITSKLGGVTLTNVASTSEKIDQNISFSDFAVIYRNHEHAFMIKRKLFDAGIPYQELGEESLFFREETKVIYNIIKFLLGKSILITNDEKNLTKVINLEDRFSESANKLLDLLLPIKKEKDEDYTKDFNLLLNEFDHYNDPYQKFIEYFDYMMANDSYDKKANKINLFTMHSAKGLEFKYIFICFFNNGIIPSKNNTDEDKRLFYVSVSRAKKGLFLISPKFYKKKNLKISDYKQFFTDLTIQTIEDENMKKELRRIERNKLKKSQIKMF